MTKLLVFGVTALAVMISAADVLARGAVGGGMRGGAVGGMMGGSSGAATGAKIGVVAGATQGAAQRSQDRNSHGYRDTGVRLILYDAGISECSVLQL